MGKKWVYRDEGKKISKSVTASKTTEELKDAKVFIKGLLDLRKSQKLEKTYIKGTQKALEYTGNGKVYVDYRLDGTATGRLSCAAYNAKKPMGVSFHTLPREKKNNIRSMFIAPKDHAFITVDYAAMELRVLAHVAKEGNMQTAFNSGQDLHTYTARLLFNKEDITKEERQIAKTVSFLIVYGGGPFNLAETMSIPMSKAEHIIDTYKDVYPGVFEYMEFVNNYIKENGYAYTIFGRRRNLPDVASSDFSVVNRAFRQGLNFTIQSTASDILLSGLLGIHRSLSNNKLSGRIVSTVHDSIELICPLSEIKQVCSIVYEELVNYPYIKDTFNINFDVPLSIDAEVGTSFGESTPVEFSNRGEVLNESELYQYMRESR
jgi:DNA polymerase-1